jgi:hypothetical protein
MKLSPIPDQLVAVNTFTNLLFFTISDAPRHDQLQVFVSDSSNPQLVPLSANNIQFGKINGSHAVIVAAASNQTGSSVITVAAKDTAGSLATTSFRLTVIDVPPMTMHPVSRPKPPIQSQSALSLVEDCEILELVHADLIRDACEMTEKGWAPTLVRARTRVKFAWSLGLVVFGILRRELPKLR